MTKKLERIKLKRASTVLWGALVAMLILLISAFSRAYTTNQTLHRELESLRPIVAAAKAEQLALEQERDYVMSDEYIEKWSREDAAMAKPDEILVVPVQTPLAPAPIQTPVSIQNTPSESAVTPFWQRWWEALTQR